MSQKLEPKVTADRYAVLDAWRGIACIAVLFYHCGAGFYWGPMAIQGYVGVHIFFVLSGYLLYKPFASSLAREVTQPNVANYLLRRIIRIYPPYVVAMCVFIAMRSISSTRSGIPSFANVVAHLGFWFNHGPEEWYLSINAVFWTLAIEAQFYLLLPFAVFVAAFMVKPFGPKSGRSIAWKLPVLFLLIGVLSRFVEFSYFTSPENRFRFRSVLSHLDLFGCGMLLAGWQSMVSAATTAKRGDIEHRSSPRAKTLKQYLNDPRFALSYLILGVGCIIASTSWAHATGGWQSSKSLSCIMFNPFICAVGAGLAVWATLNTGTIPHRLICLRPLIWAGVISYSVYLYHTGVQFFVFKLNLHPPGGWTAMTFCNAFVSLPIVLAVAYGMYLLVEKPSLSLIERLRKKPIDLPVTPSIDSARDFA